MKNAHLAAASNDQRLALAGVSPRPSSVRRIEKLRMLVSALSERDMGYLAVAAFLQCSPSSARQYLQQLGDAGVVAIRPDSGSYWLNADPAAARNFFAAQAGDQGAATMSMRTGRVTHADMTSPRYVHFMDSELLPLDMSDAPARRDPLVVALFGEATL